MPSPHPSETERRADGETDCDGAALDTALQSVPQGALALSGLTVALLLLAWLFIYFFVFLPRGMVS